MKFHGVTVSFLWFVSILIQTKQKISLYLKENKKDFGGQIAFEKGAHISRTLANCEMRAISNSDEAFKR